MSVYYNRKDTIDKIRRKEKRNAEMLDLKIKKTKLSHNNKQTSKTYTFVQVA